MLVEAANATPYGWKVANHLESEQGIFSEQDKTHTEAFIRFALKKLSDI